MVTTPLSACCTTSRLSADEIRGYLEAWQKRAIAYTDLYSLLVAGDIIAEGRTQEEVEEEIETEAPIISLP